MLTRQKQSENCFSVLFLFYFTVCDGL